MTRTEQAEHEKEARKIEAVSPEGRPAVPEVKAAGIGLMLVSIIVLLLVIGMIVALAVSEPAGIAIAALGVLIFLINPVVWASVLRASEREEVDHR